MNPELVHVFLNPSNKNIGLEEESKLPVSSMVYDSVITTSFSIDASLLDNGIPDNDTLSIWLNGQLIEDNVVPGKKRFLFRAALDNKEWNHLTIRCKSEGKIKGTGILLNMNTDEQLMKYNLVMYKNGQVDWVIKRAEKKQKELTSSQ
jgi:allantoicase